MNKKATLENWSYNEFSNRLFGEAHGHPDFPNGSVVHTSSVQQLNVKENYAITRNTYYILGAKANGESQDSKKDYAMHELWDDRAVQVIPNTGVRADGKA
jgi:hypothetical protein